MTAIYQLIILLAILLLSLIPYADAQECDPMERAYAPICCPIRDPQFVTFCISLFGRSHYNSTGMIEMHENWIGGYGIAGTPHAVGGGEAAAGNEENITPQQEGEEEEHEEEQEEEQEDVQPVITFSDEGLYPLLPLPSQLQEEENNQEETPVQRVGNEEGTMLEEKHECDPMEKAFAADCCPLRDSSFEVFCQSLFDRPHYTSTGKIEANEKWLGKFGIVVTPNGNTPPHTAIGNALKEEQEETTSATATATATEEECDPMEKAFAADCCPVKDTAFATFCDSLFGRANYNSTGIIEMHENWIGGYGIAGTPHGRRHYRP